MGNGNSKTIEVGRKIEDAIRFDIKRVEFDGDVSSYLDKVKPEIEKINHSIFWTTERIERPGSGTFTETHHSNPRYDRGDNHDMLSSTSIPTLFNPPISGSRTAVYSNASDLKTIVLIKPLEQLKPVVKINWEEAIEKANR